MDNEIIDLSKYMTLKEAAQALRKSIKQARRYITEYRPPLLEAVMIGKIYYVSRASVTRLLNKPVQVEDVPGRMIRQLDIKLTTKIDNEIARMSAHFERQLVNMSAYFEDKIDKLTAEMSTLKAELERLTAAQASPPRAQVRAQERKPAEPVAQEPPAAQVGEIIIKSAAELPPDAQPLSAWADELGLKRKTLADFIREKGLDHYAIPNPARPREKERYVTSAQKDTILEYRRLYGRL